jgi:primosomal protein N' (replication factor Y)
VVPDVSGIDKIFDYLVPESLVDRVHVGCRVRINLNGRRVGGWIVSLATPEEVAQQLTVPFERLVPIVSVSGHGVEPENVSLTRWMASEFFGSWRATLSRASSPWVRAHSVHPRHGTSPTLPSDAVAIHAARLADDGGGLLVVPPCASALNVVAALTARGSVLAVCPTQRMAVLGAASLRRRGLTTAVVDDEWDNARAGVDVVIGARSAVLAPCANLSAIVVIDEHDELHHDERAPTWNAVSVAQERARRAGVPCVLTSATPSAESTVLHEHSVERIDEGPQWPRIVIEDLDAVPVAGSLLSSELLTAVTSQGSTTVCVLNTKGKARLIVCKSCRHVQACAQCSSLLTQDDQGVLACLRCNEDSGSVCLQCGRTSFTVPRGGVSQLVSQLEKSTQRSVIEVTADSEDNWTTGSVFVGTEAVLFRVPQANTVVFADIDRDLGAPRITAQREVLSLIARASRLVGANGTVVLQTRSPQHPLFIALSQASVSDSLREWNEADVAQRRAFNLPPYAVMAHVSLAESHTFSTLPTFEDVHVARDGEALILRAATREHLRQAVQTLRETYGTALRVHADPTRY